MAGVVVVVVDEGAVVLIEPVVGSVVVVEVVAGAVVVVVAAGVSVLLSEQAERARRAEAQIAKEIFFMVTFHPFVGFGASTPAGPEAFGLSSSRLISVSHDADPALLLRRA
ncbi:hypothetical protein [Aureimonas sp. Leaf454]|uniref:hypothetical protein n=1 Tax=Aureimonas sp. Leaf454 TaxID=1736381 RepID=UPI0012E33E9D|nr:hypothetical protein [Aureimonas sp. Leaf454]